MTARFALIHTRDQWLRAAHAGTGLDEATGAVQLAWTVTPRPPDQNHHRPERLGAGLAFDNECRLYRSLPGEGRIERTHWARREALEPAAEQDAAFDLFDAEPAPTFGDFASMVTRASTLDQPRGIAVDADDHLFIAETNAGRVLVYDLWSRRLVRRIVLRAPDAAGPRPVDVAARGNVVYALLDNPPAVVRLTAHLDPVEVPIPDAISHPSRLAVSTTGTIVVLDEGGLPTAHLVLLDGTVAPQVPYASDVEFETDDVVVVAARPGEHFRRFRLDAVGGMTELPPYTARDYDGHGIVVTPAPRPQIAFWTRRGLRTAIPARLVFARRGLVTTYRLDSGHFQTSWGRLFLDACIPDGTAMHAHCVATDEPPDDEPLPRTPPAGERDPVAHPELSPPMPPGSLVPLPNDVAQPLHRRGGGIELPWAPAAGELQTYEAPIRSGPGRYLWVTLRLDGNGRHTPRVHALRAVYPGHDYLRRLPRAFSRDADAADFLHRYLALFEGLLDEIDGRAAARHALLDPHSTPAELLPWLAGFLGLVLDERWPTAARRTLVAEAAALFRARGTVAGIRRFVEIYTGTAPIVLEHFRLRGAGGAAIGTMAPGLASAIIGSGFRVGGAVPTVTNQTAGQPLADAFALHAHRFSVIVPGELTDEELDVVRTIVEWHRPAHTVVEVCATALGMRAGRGARIGVSTIIGPTGAFRPAQVSGAVLGRDAIVGRPLSGIAVGRARLGSDSRVA